MADLKTVEETSGMEVSPDSQVVDVDASKRSFMNLPTELHLQIASYLTYPDALSLKHTNRHFYGFVDTGVDLMNEWLIQRRRLHLDCPHDKGCELGSDTRFCRGSVRLLMERRRNHFECETRQGGRGCLVFGTKICTHQKKPPTRIETPKKWAIGFMNRNAALWWLLAAAIGAVLAFGFMWLRRWAIEA